MKYKIGQWVKDGATEETFVVARIHYDLFDGYSYAPNRDKDAMLFNFRFENDLEPYNCKVAWLKTNGKFECSRKKNHEGPCAQLKIQNQSSINYGGS